MFILKLMLINERIFRLYIKNTSRCSSSTCYFHLVMCCDVSDFVGRKHSSTLYSSEVRTFSHENRKKLLCQPKHHRTLPGWLCWVFLALAEKISHSGKKKNWGKKNQFPSCDEATKAGESSIEDERESERELCELEMNESITDSTAKSLPSPQLPQPSSVHSAVYNDDNLNLKYLLLSGFFAYIHVEYTYFTSHVKFHYWADRAKREK